MITHTLGFPRIGRTRELKTALEAFWAGEMTESMLKQVASALRKEHWSLQRDQGIDLLPVGDFSLYDHVLDTIVMLGMVPERYTRLGEPDLLTYFRMARGDVGRTDCGPLEMSKWFDTNYHYIVPEFIPGHAYHPDCSSLLAQLDEAAAAGFRTKPVLLGPLTFLRLGKPAVEGYGPLEEIEPLVCAYECVLRQLAEKSEWIQLDEPILALDMSAREQGLFYSVLARLISAAAPAKLLLATYFGPLGENAGVACLPGLGALHIDLAAAPGQLREIIRRVPAGTSLSLGLVNGRNVWRVNMRTALVHIDQAVEALGADRVMLGTSCSLLHVPIDLQEENRLDPEIHSWLAFAVQKCEELGALAEIARKKGRSVALEHNNDVWQAREGCTRSLDPAVRKRCKEITSDMRKRRSPYPVRRVEQQAITNLPLLPTTTIGSFPQTHELRKARRKYRQGHTPAAQYEQVMRSAIGDIIDTQQQLGLDVLVHGEPERNDMVEYFAEQLEGFCLTDHAWVQSYGSRCVKPPIIFGDVSRQKPMTPYWILFAQSLTRKPLKGMLTGPVTILRWSFARDDLAPEEICAQLALAIRDEVMDLEAAGIRLIQVDEPALREGLPLRLGDRDSYLTWATDCFRLATSGVSDETQIHTHMCYGDFDDIADWISKMDADVISIESSRSNMDILAALRDPNYPNGIGPGVWDIHSPRVPSVEEMANRLRLALEVFPAERLWVNPDCGLKTRGWCETIASLENMVAAAAVVRREIGGRDAGAR